MRVWSLGTAGAGGLQCMIAINLLRETNRWCESARELLGLHSRRENAVAFKWAFTELRNKDSTPQHRAPWAGEKAWFSGLASLKR